MMMTVHVETRTTMRRKSMRRMQWFFEMISPVPSRQDDASESVIIHN